VVRVYDIRVAARALTHVPFRDGCAALRFHPKFSGQVHLVAASGLLQVADVNSGGASARNYRVDCEGDALLSFDVSSAGDSLAFGDGGGYVHLWANQEDAPVRTARVLFSFHLSPAAGTLISADGGAGATSRQGDGFAALRNAGERVFIQRGAARGAYDAGYDRLQCATRRHPRVLWR
jgi:hypothetical protein